MSRETDEVGGWCGGTGYRGNLQCSHHKKYPKSMVMCFEFPSWAEYTDAGVMCLIDDRDQ